MSQARILVVEDEKIVAVDLQQRLIGFGYQVVGIASTGAAAIQTASEVRPDLVMMDVTLKGAMDGIEAAEEIRKAHDVPVIYVTAHADSGTLQRAKITGPFGYVLKPFEERELHTAIEMALYKHDMDRRLRESERWLSTTLRSFADAVITTDEAGKITFMNPAAERMTGWTKQEALGHGLEEVCCLLSESTGETLAGPALDAISGSAVSASDSILVARGGARAWVDLTAAPIRDDSGAALGAVVVLRDITDRRKSDESRRESEARFRGAFEYANSGMSLCGTDRRYIKVNRMLCEILGYEEREILGKLATDFIHPDDIPAGIENETRMLAREYHSRWMERRYVHRSGRIVWALVSVTLVRDAHGEPLYFLTMVQDITERKRAEEDLRVQKAYFQHLFETSPEGVVILDGQDNIIDANTSFLTMFGYTIDEVRGRNLNALIVSPEYASEAAGFSKEVFNNRIIQAESVRRRKDGSLLFVSVLGAPVVLSGKTVGIYGIYRDITERKRSEESLLTLSRAVEQSPATILITDTEGTIEYVNAKFVEVTGFTHEEAVGKNPRILKSGEMTEEEYKVLWRTIKSGNEWHGIIRNKKKNGELYWENVNISPIKAADGEIVHFLAVKEDITERRRSEELLNRERSMLRTLIDTIPDFIYVKDKRHRFLTVNAAYVHYLGAETPEVLIGKTDAEYLPADVAVRNRVSEVEVLRSGHAVVNTEEQIVDRTGARRWVQATRVPLRDAGGTVIGLVGVSHDITDRKQAEHDLQEGTRRLQTIIETVEEGITFSDLNGHFEIFNSKMEEITGYTLTEVNRSGDFSALIYPDPENHQKALDGLQAILRTGETHEVEVKIRTKSGENKVLLVSTSLIQHQERMMFLSAYRDITGRKKAEEAMAMYARQLLQAKSEAEEQAHMLERQAAELESAREQALEASRLKSEFVANMSHEIRTPMNGVIGMTGLLLDTDLSPEQREYTEIIRTSGEALLAIINDILDFSKIEAGKLTLELIDFNLHTIVEEAVDILAQKAHEKQLEFFSFIAEDVPVYMHGDPGRLRQVLVNLLGNAIKFTEKGEVGITASVEMATDNAVMVRFRIKDTGIGIPADRRNRLFKSFSQADGSTTRRYGGTGLGLAISKQLVEMMGGTIGVESQPGEGSEFWFTVMLKPASMGMPAPVPVRDLSGMRILIVDDNRTNRTILAHVTEQWNMRPTAVGSAVEALDELRRAVRAGDPYRAALLDMQMPGMDGVTLARSIRADRQLQGVLMFLLTSIGAGNNLPADAGLTACLTKPVKQSSLYDALANAFGNALAENQPATEAPEVPEKATEAQRLYRILVAEDNAINQKVALRMLAKLGHRADVVANGREAVEALKHMPYDIVIMDCNMPEMDGFAATREIRAFEGEKKHTVIIAMTANALQGDRERVLESGMDDYLPKPVNQKDLAAVIEHWAGRITPAAMPPQETGRPAESVRAPARCEILNTQRLHELAGLAEEGDTGWLRGLIDRYLGDTASRLKEIRAAVEEKDARRVGQIAHALKGSSHNIGVINLIAPSERLQKLGEDGMLDGAAALIDEMEQAFMEAREEFDVRYPAQEASL